MRRTQGRLKKLELVIALRLPMCDCPQHLRYYELVDGTTYPPFVHCLRGTCPVKPLPNKPKTVSRWTTSVTTKSKVCWPYCE